MRRILIQLFVVGIFAVDARAQSAAISKPQDEQQIRRIEAEAGQFEQTNDPSIVSLLADDWVSVSDGKVLSKEGLEKGVKSNFTAHGNRPNPFTIDKKNLVVYLFADTAVVTYTKEYRQI